ncbi:hypothetical protein [Novosphingopyxis sp.]|uniref:hypothetical protein n=1 Tax=Novosphingopyxis sp. TaxID=2709690 RepID=UPI003B5C1308
MRKFGTFSLGGAFAWQPSAALSQTLGQGEDIGVSVWRVLAALLLCLGIAVAVILALRKQGGRIDLKALASGLRSGGSIRPSRIEIVESRRASSRAEVVLLRCDEREFLVMISDTSLVTLEERNVDRAGLNEPISGDRP